MKAVLIRGHGGIEALEIATLPKPRADAGQVVIKVMAAGMNHLDTWVRRGLPGMTFPLPMVLGSDASGVVEELGEGVAGLEPGERVFVSPGYSCGRCPDCFAGHDPLCKDFGIIGEHRNGTQAEYAVLPAANVMPLPEGVSFEEGAAFALVYLTAWHMLVERARVRVGEDVLVHAGGSGVGTAAIQIARLHGARVFATTSSDEKAARLRELGVDAAINYRTGDFLQEVRRLTGKRGVDVVVDSVGQDTWDRSLKALARGGRLVTCGATSGHQAATDLRFVFSKGLSILGSTMGSRAELARVAALVGDRRLKPVIDRVLPLERVADGHRAMAERSLFGKIILKP
ncbi:MAG TPA: zinc-binding dehydrogenase [Candidatus Polarisedimenticolia bacterium]|jgi:NADPH:quinone reductase-like Zn-dependent oxidoreductase|nr:zinc-binding dehydrogenase [Candidatus Polarisedimenticolia bacterium]